MNKQEETRFDEEFTYNFCWADIVEDDLFDNIKNWITKHDKRERDRLIEEIVKEISNDEEELGYKATLKDNLSDCPTCEYGCVDRVLEIINKYKH